MKYANVMQNGMLYENRIIIQSVSDVLEYFDHIEPEFRKGIVSLLKTKEPMERWDHLARHNNFGAFLNYATSRVSITGGNILFELGNLYDIKMRNMMKHILNGQVIMINDFGGYCFINNDSTIDIIDAPEKFIDYYISKDSKYIKLENDPMLDDYTISHFSGKPLSYVCNSFTLSKDELKNILNEFKDVGGVGIWQHTTAMDIDQLYMFIDTGIEVGLTEFIMNFNSGTNDNIDELIKHYSSKQSINFKWNFV